MEKVKSIKAKVASGSEALLKKAKEEAAEAKEYTKKKAVELKPKLKAALAKAEPAVQEFFKSPTGEFLKNNPKAVIGVLTVLAFIGIPGAGPLAALVKIAGPLQAALPIIMTMAAPAAALLV